MRPVTKPEKKICALLQGLLRRRSSQWRYPPTRLCALSSDNLLWQVLLRRRILLLLQSPCESKRRSPPAVISSINASPSLSSFVEHLEEIGGQAFTKFSSNFDVKQLQEQVKVLETESKRKSAESVVYVEKSEVCGEED
ncbi:hypothetical protein HN873_055526, partial [Arachis hypogaea]